MFSAPGESVHPYRGTQRATGIAAQTKTSGKSGNHNHFFITGSHFFGDFRSAAYRQLRQIGLFAGIILQLPTGSLPEPIFPQDSKQGHVGKATDRDFSMSFAIPDLLLKNHNRLRPDS